MKEVKVINNTTEIVKPTHEKSKKIVNTSTHGNFEKNNQKQQRWEQSLYEPIER